MRLALAAARKALEKLEAAYGEVEADWAGQQEEAGEEDATTIVSRCNDLAGIFYRIHGYRVEAGYRFDRASHPQEQSMWNLAATAYEHITGLDVGDVLSELAADEDEGGREQ
jgi:hypothetical protein